MSEHPRAGTAGWILIALAGLAIAVALSVAASNLSTQPIGLEGEPLRAGERLAPVTVTETSATTATTTAQKNAKSRTKTPTATATATGPVPTTTTTPPPVYSPPATTPTQTATSGTGTTTGGHREDDRGGVDRDHDDD